MSGKNIKALFTISVLTMALFLVSFAIPAYAQFTTTGKVLSINKGAGTITVEPYFPLKSGEFREGQPIEFGLLRTDPYNRNLTRQASIMRGDEVAKFDDLKVGDWVTVTYHQESTGAIVADGIAITSPPASLSERRVGVAPAYSGGQAVAPAYESRPMTGHPGYYDSRAGLLSYSGRIIAIDHGARSLALDPMTARGEHKIFALRPGAAVLIGNENRSFSDLKLGDWVTVNYHQESLQNIVADSVAVITPPSGTPSTFREGTSLYPQGSSMRDRYLASNTFNGKVVAIDKDSRILIVSPTDMAASNFSSRGEQVFVLRDGSLINMDDRKLSFGDLKVGDNVVISYHDEGGSIIADNISISAPSLVPFEERG
jgi:hypothetical protein